MREAGEIFDRSARTMRRWIACGTLTPVRVNGNVYFHSDEILQLVFGRLEGVVREHMGRFGRDIR